MIVQYDMVNRVNQFVDPTHRGPNLPQTQETQGYIFEIFNFPLPFSRIIFPWLQWRFPPFSFFPLHSSSYFPPKSWKTTYDSYKLDTKVKGTSVYDRNQLNNVISELVIIDSITVMIYMNYSYVLLLDVIGVIRLNCQPPPFQSRKKKCYQIRFLLALFGIWLYFWLARDNTVWF